MRQVAFFAVLAFVATVWPRWLAATSGGPTTANTPANTALSAPAQVSVTPRRINIARGNAVYVDPVNRTVRAVPAERRRVEGDDVAFYKVAARVRPDEAPAYNLRGMSFLPWLHRAHKHGRLALEQ